MKIWLSLCLLCIGVDALAERQNLTPLTDTSALYLFNGTYLALKGQNVLTSNDLKHWTSHAVPTRDYIHQAFYGNGVYLIKTTLEVLVTNDLEHYQPLPGYIGQAIFDGIRFIATTAQGISTSTDGLNWELLAPGNFYAIAHAGGRTIAIGTQFAIIEGDNVSLIDDVPEGLVSVAALPGLIVANDARGQVTVSSDGRQWSHLATRDQFIRNVYAAGGRFFSSDYNRLFSSTNGLDWVPVNGMEGQFRSIVDDGQRVLIFAGELQTPDDQNNLNFVALGHDRTTDAASLEGRLILFRESGVYTSDNGLDWTKTRGRFFAHHRALTDDALVVSYEKQLTVTSDGLNWSNLTMPDRIEVLRQTPTGFLLGYESDGTCFIFESSDGLNWEPVEADCLALGGAANSKVMLNSLGGQYWRSTNGVDWEPSGTFDQISQISTYKDTFFIKNHNDDGLLISSDGLRFERLSMTGDLTVLDGLWRNERYTPDWYYSKDGRAWAKADIGAYPLAIWQGKAIWISQSVFQSDIPQTFRHQSLIPWVVDNQTWQSRIVINNTNDSAVSLELKAVIENGDAETVSLELAAGEVLVRETGQLFPQKTRYSLYVDASASGVYPVFQVNAKINDVFSPSQTAGLLLDKLSPRLVFPFMNAADVNAIVLVATESSPYTNVRATLHLLDPEGKQLAEKVVILQGSAPFASQVTELFPDVTLPELFKIKVDGGKHLAGTAFIFTKDGQPSMANAFSLPEY